ncbi:metal-dependent hydrolase [Litoreibacter janthinus]|uniref:LexA-binding, inner membrane-associated putative hydrolase n=1 Tax=Litoreibacter janthinus TaxID=670154 RepID=A0A1I6H5H4_9RHOB|nr:metal-dependent hydrolase [Litoreibacter janthinus]SFR49685.1 LexA-binding, inner membrane-associated putative hydrolase [Litoreibacter janthinus]
MITAHLPSGYILGRTAQRYGVHPWLMPAALLGAVLPDFDLIWFYLIDNRAFHHHSYWVHIPGFWLVVAALTLLGLRQVRPRWLPPARVFFAAIFLHLVLDTVAGDIAWAWPFSDRFFHFFTVPATQSHFILSFLLHWTFSLELMIWALAIYLYAKVKL